MDLVVIPEGYKDANAPQPPKRTHLDWSRQVEEALPHLSVRDVLSLLMEHADNQREAADLGGDKWQRIRWAMDARALWQLREKIHN